MRNIRQKQYSHFPAVHDFGKPCWGLAYVPCMTNLRALYAWVVQWHVTCMLSLAEYWQSRRALSNHVCAHSVISMWHVVCLQHLARACSEQSRPTSVLPINHVIEMPIGICESWLFAGDNFSRNLFTAIAFVPVRWRQFFAKSTRAYLSMRAGTHAVRWAATLGGALTPPLCPRVGSS